MVRIPFVKGSKINQLLCLTFSGMTAVLLLLGSVYWLLGYDVFLYVTLVLAAITAGFGVLYLVLWQVFKWQEQQSQLKLEQAAQLPAEENEGALEYREFVLPKQKLAETAYARFQKIAAALLIVAVVVFVILAGSNLAGGGRIWGTGLFCILVITPGILLQYLLYRRYADSIPERIVLFPGKLIVDNHSYRTGELEQITISAYKNANRNAIQVYRKMIVKEKRKERLYTIDYCAPSEGNPRWEGYGVFLESLKNWAKQNSVPLKVDYMN